MNGTSPSCTSTSASLAAPMRALLAPQAEASALERQPKVEKRDRKAATPAADQCVAHAVALEIEHQIFDRSRGSPLKLRCTACKPFRGSPAKLAHRAKLPQFRIPYALIAGVAVASAGFLIVVLGMFVRSGKRAVVSGREHLIGAVGEALEDFEREGWARVHGERWKVRTAQPVRRGWRLRVTGVHDLVLEAVPEGEDT